MKYDINEHAVVNLVPVAIRKISEKYLIINKKDSTVLTTSKAGARVVELIELRKSILEIRECVSKEFNADISAINIMPILESLIENKFISQIGNEVLFKERFRAVIHLKYFLTVGLHGGFINVLMKTDRIRLTYPWLKTMFFKRVQIDTSRFDRARNAFIHAGFPGKDFFSRYTNLIKQISFDKTLFFNLSNQAMNEWIKNYFIIENEKYFENIKDKTLIYCGYHFANYEMLPIVFGNYGVEVCTPIALKGEYFTRHIQRLTTLKNNVFPIVPHIYSRSQKDGILLFRALKNNKSILLYCDTHILLTDAYFKVRFLRRIIKVNRGAAMLHKKTNIPIVPVLTFQKGNICHIKFLPQINFVENESEYEIVQMLFKILEDHIKSYPYQWVKWEDLESMIAL